MVSKVIVGDNDLYSWCLDNNRFDLIDEWAKDKNSKPMSAYSKGSMKKVWWHCTKGHEWEAMIGNRIKGRGCPYCSNKRLLLGYNDLETWCNQNDMLKLIDEWDYQQNELTPKDYVYGSQVKVNWLCKKRHSYLMSIYNRTKGKGNCPYCNSQVLLKGYNDLATKNPQLISEWNNKRNNPLTPSDVMVKSNRKVWWKCKSGHEWLCSVADRTEGSSCPYCSGRKALPGYNDLATINPDLAMEWHPFKNGSLLPSQVRPHAGKKVWWQCPKGHEWEATIDSRSSGRGCPYCNHQTSFAEQAILFYVKKAFSDAISRDTHLGFEIDIFIPSLSTGIEYDGQAWHNNKQKQDLDNQKNKLCTDNKIRLIRIREPELPALSDCICIHRQDKRSNDSLTKAI